MSQFTRKLAVLTFLVLALATVASAGSIDDLNENGFRDLKFGDQVDAQFEFESTEPNGLVSYTRKGDDLAYEGIKLKTIQYSFVRGQLARVVLVAKFKDDARLRAAIEGAFGSPSPAEPKTTMNERRWPGKKIQGLYLGPISWDGSWKKSSCMILELKELPGLLSRRPAVAEGRSTSSAPARESVPTSSGCGPGKHWVNGYMRRGKYVSGYCRG